jgi:mRNA interferase MazF
MALKSDLPKQGDIVWTRLDPSLGKEKRGTRPALVVSNPVLQEVTNFVWVVPITHGNFDFPLHVKLDSRTKTDGNIQVEQLRTIGYQIRKFDFIETLPQDLLQKVLINIRKLASIDGLGN